MNDLRRDHKMREDESLAEKQNIALSLTTAQEDYENEQEVGKILAAELREQRGAMLVLEKKDKKLEEELKALRKEEKRRQKQKKRRSEKGSVTFRTNTPSTNPAMRPEPVTSVPTPHRDHQWGSNDSDSEDSVATHLV